MIGNRLKELREELKLLQKELADKLNLTQQTISLYESNKREPDFDILEKIADFFDISVDYLLGRTDIKHTISKATDNLEISESTEISSISDDIKDLTPESQADLKKYIELLKIKDMKDRNKSDTEMSDEISK